MLHTDERLRPWVLAALLAAVVPACNPPSSAPSFPVRLKSPPPWAVSGAKDGAAEAGADASSSRPLAFKLVPGGRLVFWIARQGDPLPLRQDLNASREAGLVYLTR